MNALQWGWDGRTADQWLDEAKRFEKMAERFGHHEALNASFASLASNARTRALHASPSAQSARDHDCDRLPPAMVAPVESDLDYFHSRACAEEEAAKSAKNMRVRRVHLELAQRYRSLIRAGRAFDKSGLHLDPEGHDEALTGRGAANDRRLAAPR